jgi:integrase
MLLATIVDQITKECDLAYSTVSQYSRSVKRFSEFLGHAALDSDLDRENLNKFVQFVQSKATNTTASNYRRALCRIWNYLTEEHAKPAYEIRRLRRPKSIEQPVIAWSLEDVNAILKAASEVEGVLKTGVPANAMFSALIWSAYDTGLRPSDLFRIRWDQLDPELSCITLVQNKTRKPHIVFLREEALDAIQRIRSVDNERIFPLTWAICRRWMERVFSLATQYGFKRLPGKNLGTLRKTNATQVYISDGESAAAESLGHTSGTRIVRKHYIDHRALRKYSVPKHPNGK